MFSEKIDEASAHELEVIDAIVRGGGEVRPEDAALTDFALLVRNARPLPDHAEAAALDARVKEALGAKRPRERMIFKPAFAGVCGLIVLCGAVVAVGLGTGDYNSGDDAGRPMPDASTNNSLGAAEAPSTVQKSVAGDQSGAADSVESLQSVAPNPPGVTSAGQPRDVARETRLTLAADGDEIERLADRVNAIVDKYGGYVAQSSVRAGEGNRGRASFQLMIPAAQYKVTLASLSKLAHVRSRSQSSEDITTTVNSAERELRRWTARVNRLEDQLAAAQTDAQRIILRRQLSSAKAALRQATGQVRANRARVNYVPIALTIVADTSAADKDKGEIAKAFDRAGEILTAIAAVVIVALAVLIPPALIVGLALLGMRRWNRGRSERTIDASAAAQSE
ncbi:MAG: DUF4349 domain-containing protein [Thermoleophilaceae bacterium]|nr:DUF4349 domain-containing protein [Thermoleophilaceae bacterium]